MPTTILDGETYEQARHRRFTEEAKVIEKMQQDELIRMAREECGFAAYGEETGSFHIPVNAFWGRLERFFNLAFAAGAAHEAEKWKAENKRDYENWKMAAEKAAECEREACAKVCDELVLEHPGRADLTAEQCAAAIRARGEK